MRIAFFSFLTIVIEILFSSPIVVAETNYPEKTQVQVREAIHKDISKRLRNTFEQYNQGIARQTGVIESAKKLGLNDRDIAQIAAYVNESGHSLPKAEWKDGEITIQNSGYSVVIGINEYWNRSIRINGKTFSWDWSKPVSSNLDRYNAYFGSNSKAESWFHFPALIENAWADELFRIKAAGLQLYFVVTATGEMGGQLYRLNDKVKELVTLCEAPEPPAGQEDPFLKATLRGTAIAQQFKSSILLRNCNSIKDYAKKPVGVIQGEPVLPRIPADLCGNLGRLAKCVHTQMDAPAASNKSKKDTPPSDKEEWYEPQKANSAGAAK